MQPIRRPNNYALADTSNPKVQFGSFVFGRRRIEAAKVIQTPRQLRRKRTPVGMFLGIPFVKTQPTKLKNSIANVYCFQSCSYSDRVPSVDMSCARVDAAAGRATFCRSREALASNKAPSAS